MGIRKHVIVSVALVVCFATMVYSAASVSDDQIIDLVDKVSKEIETDTQGVFDKISSGLHPYKNKDNKAFYVFVYDKDVKIVAHPKQSLVGRSYKGKPDVKGKKFRDDIVNGALKNNTGWVDYSYEKPGEKGIHAKTTYYKLITGSDGKKYIVCAGKYRN